MNRIDRLDAVEQKIREIKEVAIETTQNEAQRKRTEKSDLGNNTKFSTMHVIRVLEGKEKGKRIKNIFEEIMGLLACAA